MKTNCLISEGLRVDNEIIVPTSAAGATSLGYDMQRYDQALVVACCEGAYTTITIDLMESSGATIAGTSAAGSKAGITIGGASTLISTAGGVRQVTLTFTTATTVSDTIKLTQNGVQKTFTNINTTANLNSSAWTSTNLYFGSTVGSSANTGLQTRIDSLKTAINSTLGFGDGIACTTGSTAAITLTARGEGFDGGIGFNTTFAVPTAQVNQAVVGFDIAAEQLASTANKRYISLKASTASTSVETAVTVIRSGGHHKPTVFGGKLST